MRTWPRTMLPLALLAGLACAPEKEPSETDRQAPAVCTDEWYRSVEGRVTTGDGQGHGPDLGSDEWKSVVEFKLGIRGNPEVPARDTEAWCRYVDQLIEQSEKDPGSGSATTEEPSLRI